MLVVIDTNALLVSVSKKLQSYWLWSGFKKGKFNLAFTTEILAEYEEQIALHWMPEVAENTVSAIINAPNGVTTTVYYHLYLITVDPDDNKFSDCAFASNADYLITNDTGFDVLKKTDFPPSQLFLCKNSSKP